MDKEAPIDEVNPYIKEKTVAVEAKQDPQGVELVSEACARYDAYLNVDAVLERKMPGIEKIAEELFTGLDDIRTQLASISFECEKYNQLFPSLLGRARELRNTFTYIDLLEKHMLDVHRDLTALEKSVDTLEAHFKSKNGKQSRISRWIRTKTSQNQQAKGIIGTNNSVHVELVTDTSALMEKMKR